MRLIGFAVALMVSMFIAPHAAKAQPVEKTPKVGFLRGSLNENTVAFVQGMRDKGYVDGQTAVIETRIYGSAIERLPQYANELVALKCDVIFAAGGPYAIAAAVKATSVIPIVGIDLESDPVARGWATSLNRPGRNFTGIFLDLPELGGKLVELLKEVRPRPSRVGVLWDTTIGEAQFRATEAAAHTAVVTVHSLGIQRIGNVQDAFDRGTREGLQGIRPVFAAHSSATLGDHCRGSEESSSHDQSLHHISGVWGSPGVWPESAGDV